jgi:GT2 family glycosyltransferase
MTDPTVTAILVAYNEPVDLLLRAAASLRGQSLAPAQIVCLDQSPDARFRREFAAHDPSVEVLAAGENLGYPSSCNRAAQRARGDYLLFLNPDAHADPDCVERLVEACERDPRAAVAGAQVLFPDRRRVNAGDNPLHLSGISWAGRYGQPVEAGPPRDAAVVSGAALLVRRDAWVALGGYTEGFFMYYDDVDLAWRARIAGWRVVFCPAARVVHDYEFIKGAAKWRCLERNRWWCLLAHLQLRTLLVLAPILLAVEAAVWRYAGRQGWGEAKRDAWRELWRDRQALRARRREVQASRTCDDAAVLRRMTATVDTPLLDGPLVRAAAPALRAYHAVALVLIGAKRATPTGMGR